MHQFYCNTKHDENAVCNCDKKVFTAGRDTICDRCSPREGCDSCNHPVEQCGPECTGKRGDGGFGSTKGYEKPKMNFCKTPEELKVYAAKHIDTGDLRTFSSGATRDTAGDKPEFGGFLSPIVLRKFGEYMHKHRKQSDGSMRASDNWKKGMPRRVFLESLLRHAIDVWGYITSDDVTDISTEQVLEALMAIIFNAQGLAREILLQRSV